MPNNNLFLNILLSSSKNKSLFRCFVDKQKGKCYTYIGYKMRIKSGESPLMVARLTKFFLYLNNANGEV